MKIFIVLGTQKFQLNRLLRKVDELIEQRVLEDTIFAQIGQSDYIPKYYEYERFLDKSDFEKHIASCDLVLTHSGVGTIVTGLLNNKPVLVYPRLKKYGEHIDNHQVEIAKAYSNNGYVTLCAENDSLLDKIEETKRFHCKEYISSRQEINVMINEYIIHVMTGENSDGKM